MFLNASIETERLIILPFRDEDADEIFKMASEPNHFKYMPDDKPTRVEEIQNLINWSKGCNEKNTKEKIYKFNLSITLKDTGEFIGICGLGPHDVFQDETEIYYSILEKQQGKGYAKEAANAVMRYGFDTIGLKKMIATVHPENISSVKIIEGLGMEHVRELSGLQGEIEDYNGYQLYAKVID